MYSMYMCVYVYVHMSVGRCLSLFVSLPAGLSVCMYPEATTDNTLFRIVHWQQRSHSMCHEEAKKSGGHKAYRASR